jgi:alkanesulfonate monooxygenase SsuD/methylene tetrahydromethanopterin reductase-like flavin-dependent oxidoreductase (luciferase family)
LPALRIDVVAQFAQFQDSLNQIQRSVDKSVGGLSRGFGSLSGLIAGLGVSLSAGGFAAFVKNAINAQDEMGKMAQRAGLTVESLSALEHSARLSDVSLESLGQAMKKLSVNMLEVQSGSGEAQGAFKALNVSVTNTSGQLRGADRVLFDIADKFAAMEDGAGKTALAVKLFGRAGADLIPLLNQGADGLKRNADEAKRFGIVISTEAAKRAEEFNDNLTRIAQQSKGAGIAIANELLPWLNRMVEQLLEGTRIAGSFLGALRLFGLSSITSDNAGDKIRDINTELTRLRKLVDTPPSGAGGAMIERVNTDIKALEKQLEFAKFLQRQSALQLPGGDTPGEQARLRSRLQPAPKLIDDKSQKEAENIMERFQTKLRALQDQAAKVFGGGSEADEIGRFLRDQEKDLAKLAPAERARIVEALKGAAARVDAERGLLLAIKQTTEAEEEFARVQSEAMSFVPSTQAKERDRERLENMIGAEILIGKTNEEAQAFIDNMLEGIDFLIAEEEKAMRAAAGFNEQGELIVDTSKELREIGRDIGLTFSSAFEDAVTGGKKFRDILAGIAQDLLKLATRKLVTEPLLKSFEGLLTNSSSGIGSFFTDLFKPRALGGPVSAGGAFLVGEKGPELFVPGTSGSIVSNDKLSSAGGTTIYADMRGASVEAVHELRSLVMQINGTLEQRAVSAVVSATTRGGAAGMAIRGG